MMFEVTGNPLGTEGKDNYCFDISDRSWSLSVKEIKVAMTFNLSVFIKEIQLIDRENKKINGQNVFDVLQDTSQEFPNNFI